MDPLKEEIEKIFRQEQDDDRCREEEGRIKSVFGNGITCLLNIILLGVVIFGPVAAAMMIGSFLKSMGKLLFMKEK